MTDKTTVNTFKIKYLHPTIMYASTCHIDNIMKHKDLCLPRRARARYFNEIDEIDKDNVVVTSATSEPLVFYKDGPLIKCAKTDRALSCFTCKNEARGGSMLFLTKNKRANILFNNELHLGTILKYYKSPIYPGYGHKGGGYIYNSRRHPEEKDPLIAYHIDKNNRKGYFIEFEPVGTIDVVLEHPPNV